MSLPENYKQAVFRTSGGSLLIENATVKLPSAGEILVKVDACGVCYSDVSAQKNALGGGFPIVPGHEIVGHVAAIGDEVSGWTLGERIGGGWHGGHDGTCVACHKGYYQMCENLAVNGVTRGGGYAEFCTIRAEAAVRLPSNISALQCAPLLCAGVSVFNSIRNMKVPVGETVAIQGLGGLGHLAIQYSRKMGYRVVALSRGAEKADFAKELGAHQFIDTDRSDPGDALQSLGGASLIVTTAPTAEAIAPLMKGLGVLGKLLMLSLPGELAVDTGLMVRKGLSVQVWPSGHSKDTEEAISFATIQGVKCLVQEYSLDQANEAFDAMLKGSVRFRAVITM